MSFPPHMPIIPPIPFLPPGAPMMMPPNMAIPPPGIPTNGAHKTADGEKKSRLQAATTVFVGSISDRAPDAMIKRMLHNCGSVVNWKRVQGANGKLQAFGFCEYENPEGTLRCIRLLNGWLIQDKKLVVKVDSKTKALLDEYKKKKRHELAKRAANDTTAFKFIYEEDDDDEDGKKSNSTDPDGKKKSGEEGEIEEEEDDYIDDATRREDHTIKLSLETIMREYSREMNQRALEAKELAAREAAAAAAAGPPMSQAPALIAPIGDSSAANAGSPSTRRSDSGVGGDDEEGKRSLINNEILMFRDRFKDEDTKMRNTEKERKDRYERERALLREKRAAEEAASSGNHKSSVSPPSSRDRSSPKHERSGTSRRDRSSPSDDRYRSSSSRSNTSNSVRNRTSDRRSPPSSSRYDRRSPPSSSRYNRHRSRTKSPVSKSYPGDEDDEDILEKKKADRRLREKESRYRERLKTWEQRERKKQNDYKMEKRRELARLHDEEKEGKRLLAFFEDYNDENDDPKYYNESSLARRLKDREHEIDLDNRDRRHEKEEIEELRQKLLLQGNIDDVDAEIKRRLEKEEESIRKSLADLTRASDESGDELDNDEQPTNHRKDSSNVAPVESANTSTGSIEQASRQASSPQMEAKTSPRQTSALGGAPITGTKIPSKRKLAVNDVDFPKRNLLSHINNPILFQAFRDDQDDDSANTYQKKSKLSAIPDQQPAPIAQNSPNMKDDSSNRTSAGKATAVTPTNNANSAQAQEEKRQAVRKLIESIPTKKEDLFTFPLDWSLLDSNLMEKRIKPWVTKKIVEYIGEEEATLTDFICSSIMSKKSAEAILADIRVVLDDEAEVFVVKMWRLIVYEIEAKRQGLSK
ncbi:unnamed protein product [Adineta ricciae]|uniref:RNA-binding protein 25 n=1 Tax=Adineta ricciae TaxID=249248 RepID=A0A814QBJ1_ADIRI|nr:unnamed protein product [Adineta ricciae]